jgi:FkbM family methyltransferase
MQLKLTREERFGINAKAAYLRLTGAARYNLAASFLAMKKTGMLRETDTLIDVGAHVGLFTRSYKACFPDFRVILIEPVARFREQIPQNLAGYKNYEVLPYAAGSEPGEMKINISSHPSATSLLPITARHDELWPGSGQVTHETIKIEKLDDLLKNVPGYLFLKLDVQGFEEAALNGASETLKRTRICQIEVNFETLFEGEASLSSVIRKMETAGFRLGGVFDPIFGQGGRLPASADIIFYNTQPR